MNIKTCFGISSCKGGVGKSTVACNIAITLANQGYKVGLLDADIYGPSVPTLLGIGDKEPKVEDGKFLPFEVFGIKAMSIGFLVNEEQAIVWRGPMLAKGLDGLINKTIWGDLDYLIVDFPPGTGDVQISMSQKLKLDGTLIITTPQLLSLKDVIRGINMFIKVDVPILGVVENMSYLEEQNGNWVGVIDPTYTNGQAVGGFGNTPNAYRWRFGDFNNGEEAILVFDMLDFSSSTNNEISFL